MLDATAGGMTAVQKYEDLDAYQLSRDLRDAIFRLS
jgi:hypothetical protein